MFVNNKYNNKENLIDLGDITKCLIARLLKHNFNSISNIIIIQTIMNYKYSLKHVLKNTIS